jgi:hypothetical protein
MELEEVKKMVDGLVDEIEKDYEGIRDLFETEEDYKEEIQKLVMLQTVIMQINEIFSTTVYNAGAEDILLAARDSVSQLLEKFREEYLEAANETKEVPGIPDLDHIISWVETIHKNIALQLFSQEFFDSVLVPAYTDISGAILDTAREEEEEEEEDETHH